MGLSIKGIAGGLAGLALGGPTGALIGYNMGAGMDAADQQADAAAQANASIASSTAAQQQAQREAIAASLAGSQIGYDTYREAQKQQMPWNLASLSALQVLPQLQQALGLPAYNVQQSIPGLPNVNFAEQFRQALAGMNGQQYIPGQGVNSQPVNTGTTPTPDSGIRVNVLQNPDGSPQNPNTLQNVPTNGTALTPYTGAAYNVEASPLYEFQKKEAVEALRNQLAAQGLGQSTYGQREESRIRQGLAAQERERQVANMFQMLNFGFGSPIANSSGAANFGMQAGSDVSQGLVNQGAIAASGGLAQANLGMNYANAAAQQPDPIMQAVQVYGMFNQGGGLNLFGNNSGGSSPMAYNPSVGQQLSTMPGMGIAIPQF